MPHPWGLTDLEMESLASLIEHERPSEAAEASGVSVFAFHDSIRRARIKMQVKTTVMAAVKWDRWVQGRRKVEPENQVLLDRVNAQAR